MAPGECVANRPGSEPGAALRFELPAIFGLSLDLDGQLVFYGSYHTRPLNQLIHFVFVPLILASVLTWLAYLPPVWAPLSAPGQCGAAAGLLVAALCEAARVDAATLLILSYSAYYVALDAAAGLSW